MFYATLKTLHVLCIIVWLGGMVFAHFFLRPALAQLEPAVRLRLMHDVLGRFFQAVLVASLLTLVSFVLLAAAYVPGNRIKAAIGHPMVAGTKVWAFSHLLANGNLADVVLFGAFLAWAIADFVAARRRDRVAGTARPAGTAGRTLVAAGVGIVAWGVFAFLLHGPLIGVRPFG